MKEINDPHGTLDGEFRSKRDTDSGRRCFGCIRNAAKDIRLVREAKFAAEAIAQCPHIVERRG